MSSAHSTPERELLTTGEASRLLGFSPQYLGQLVRSGRIQFVQTPYGRLYDADEVERVRQEREAAR